MKVFHSVGEAQGLQGCALALGNFDGVHLGHQALFAEAARHAAPVALTFDPHPGKVLQPELAPKLITTRARKLELFEQYGLSAAIVQPFTRDYARTTPEAFEASILDQVGARHLVVGSDFTYGSKRAGTVETLKAAAAKRGAQVHIVAPVTVDGVVVSSTKIREMILEGRVAAVKRLLGRYFDLDGTVVTGKGRGRGIGFPTANVDTQNELRPAPGVYAVRASLRLRPRSALPIVSARRGLAKESVGVRETHLAPGRREHRRQTHVRRNRGDDRGSPARLHRRPLREESSACSSWTASVQSSVSGRSKSSRFRSKRDVETVRTVIARAGE